MNTLAKNTSFAILYKVLNRYTKIIDLINHIKNEKIFTLFYQYSINCIFI